MLLPQVFLLSPASCSGQRAQLLFREQARFDLALRLRTAEGAPLADVFSFLSGLSSAFVGRGDMSRGGLLLRAVDEGRELAYVPVAGAVVRGSRPPKLPRRA